MSDVRQGSFWGQVAVAWHGAELAMLPCLGVVAYILFRFGDRLGALEGALLMTAAAGLIGLGRHGWAWYRSLQGESSLEAWAQRTLVGERLPLQPGSLPPSAGAFPLALNAVLQDERRFRAEVAQIREAVAREWRDLDALLESAEQGHAEAQETVHLEGARREALGGELRQILEEGLSTAGLEVDHRTRSEQHRLQGQVAEDALGQLLARLDQVGNLLDELQDSFPTLRREEEALQRLADAGFRRGARLSLAVKGLVVDTPNLVAATRARQLSLQDLRQAADAVKDESEAMARRLEAFREETQVLIRAFDATQGSTRELDLAAQQTGLLAVNAAILGQQGGGGEGLLVIGGRLRTLSDQTVASTAELDRTLDRHREGLRREIVNLWDLQEVAGRLHGSVQDLLRVAGRLDLDGLELERSLDAHLGVVDQVRQDSERAELSLREVGECAAGLATAQVRQWKVEAKLAPERERLAQVGGRLGGAVEALLRLGQEADGDAWGLVVRQRLLQGSPAYQELTGRTSLPTSPEGPAQAPVWRRVALARSRRRPRLTEAQGLDPRPSGRRGSDGAWALRLLGRDALGQVEPSALAAWECDAEGLTWRFRLAEPLCTDAHRAALLEALRESPLRDCLPGLLLRVAPQGVDLLLPSPYPGLPEFLAGLGLEIPLEAGAWERPFRAVGSAPLVVSHFLWLGPAAGGGLGNPCLSLVHQWVRHLPEHEGFLHGLPHPGDRPACPLPMQSQGPDSLPAPMAVRGLGLAAETDLLEPLRERLLQAGAHEGLGGAVLCAVGIGHAHPEALLLRLFQADAGLGSDPHPALEPYRIRFREEVLAERGGDPHAAAWTLLEDLQREGWVLPLPLS